MWDKEGQKELGCENKIDYRIKETFCLLNLIHKKTLELK